jgi:5-methylcytosine-specific restriction endonuclease McrA
MIPIRIPDTQKALDAHWNGIKDLILKNNLVFNQWIDRNDLSDLLGNNIEEQIKRLILAEPIQLRSIINQIRSTNEGEFDFLPINYTSFTKRRGAKSYKASDLLLNTGITVCPYCNRTFIQSTKRTNGLTKRTCQLDHFFPKDIYPYLALCFYNLIPSCSACNHIKSTEEIGISPYEINSADDVLTFEWKPKDAAFNYPKGNIAIELKCNSAMQNNIKVFGLTELYSHHDDIVKEMLLKSEIYSPDYIQSLVEQFPDLIENEEEALRIVTGNYILDEDLGKRPLSKLTRDIARDVGFIK